MCAVSRWGAIQTLGVGRTFRFTFAGQPFTRASRALIVIVTVASCRHVATTQNVVAVEVWGAVNQPGIVQVLPGSSVQTVVGKAGGLQTGPESPVRIARFVNAVVSTSFDMPYTNARPFDGFVWRDGDILVVPSRSGIEDGRQRHPEKQEVVCIHVTGIVQEQGYHWVDPTCSLVEIIKQTGGINAKYHNGIRVFSGVSIDRHHPDKEDGEGRWWVPANEIGVWGHDHFRFREGDEVVVKFNSF